MPERVWEQSLTSDLVRAGMEYTVLDDFHFKNAGLEEHQLHGYYITENDGQLLSVFPGSERLRYTIPFQEPHEGFGADDGEGTEHAVTRCDRHGVTDGVERSVVVPQPVRREGRQQPDLDERAPALARLEDRTEQLLGPPGLSDGESRLGQVSRTWPPNERRERSR